ncbi:MAG: hypothetical protein JXB48_24330 [Candidatus Latescibacteria bacterium]|nr:hypothetical protein [Candidatus Latescibacterota bacterium]
MPYERFTCHCALAPETEEPFTADVPEDQFDSSLPPYRKRLESIMFCFTHS